jgi:cob(I)alamin adenosyltransferase
MNKFYTSRGDQGETDHLGTGRLSKSHIRIQTVGALDEASAALGFARAQISDPSINQLIKTVQTDLYRIMSIVSLEKPNPDKIPDLESDQVVWLEEQIDHFGSQTESPKSFILPGENLPAGAIGLARTIVRRAERDLVALNEEGILFSETALSYLNRLSSLCFTLELFLTQNPPAGTENTS